MSDAALQTQDAQAPQVDNLDDDIRSAISELKGTGAVEQTEEARITIDRASQPRNEQGQFAKPEETKPEKQDRKVLTLPEKKSTTSAPAPAQGSAIDPTAAPAPAAPLAKAPDAWTASMKEAFKALPPEVQAYVNQRESEAHKALTAQDSERQLGKQVRELTAPYMAQIQAEGGDPLKAYQLYLNTAHILRGNDPMAKAQAIASVMQQFGVNPQVLFSTLGGVNHGAGVAVQPPNPIVETLQQRIDRLEQGWQQDVQQRQIREDAALQSEIDGFASAPGHEHFSQVRSHMGWLLENGHAQTMDEAYDQACNANPEIRSILSAAKAREAEEKRVTELTAKTDAAKRASGSITGSPGGMAPITPQGSVGSVEDDVRAAMRQVSGRV